MIIILSLRVAGRMAIEHAYPQVGAARRGLNLLTYTLDDEDLELCVFVADLSGLLVAGEVNTACAFPLLS
jgi:hypothetical protein